MCIYVHCVTSLKYKATRTTDVVVMDISKKNKYRCQMVKIGHSGIIYVYIHEVRYIFVQSMKLLVQINILRNKALQTKTIIKLK